MWLHSELYVITQSVQYDHSGLWAYKDEQYFCTVADLVHLPVPLRLRHWVILQHPNIKVLPRTGYGGPEGE